MHWIVGLVIAALGIALLLGLGRWTTRRSTGTDGHLDRLRQQRLYQPLTLLGAGLLTTLSLLWAGRDASVLRLGDFGAPAYDLGWLGFPEGERWSSVGVTFTVMPLVVTVVVVYLQVLRGRPGALRHLPRALLWAVPFSLVNALTEELIFRAALVQSLRAGASTEAIAVASGLAFGLPHYLGTPGRVPGVLMAGFLGWIAARSVLETNGLGWAFVMHFAQDVPIISMMLIASWIGPPPARAGAMA